MELPIYMSSACLFPFEGGENLSLIDSTIHVNAESVGLTFRKLITFNCSFWIYNPNDTVNTTLILPISDELAYLTSSSLTTVNGTAITVVDADLQTRGEIRNKLEDFGYSHYDYYYNSFRCINNLALLENSTSLVQFIIESDVSVSLGRYPNSLYLSHFTHLINIWNSYSRHVVEFLVNGSLPSRYSNYSVETPERKCLVTNYEYGTSYYWNWEHEEIIEDIVYLEWVIPRNKPFTFSVSMDFCFALISLPFFLIVYVYFNRRKTRFKHE